MSEVLEELEESSMSTIVEFRHFVSFQVLNSFRLQFQFAQRSTITVQFL